MFVGVGLRQVTDLAKVLRSHLGRLVPDDVPLPDAQALWDAYDEIERCAVAAKTLLAARLEESRTWARTGDRSAAEYMARKAGSSVGAARNGLETSKRLRRLPATEAAVRRGELSRAQAEAIADAAAVNPAAEQSLLDAAPRSTVVDLRQQANRAKAAGDPDPSARHRRIHRQRRLRRFTDGEGAWNLQGRGTPDAGGVFNAALDPIIDEFFRTARRDGRRESREAYAFDALIELARRACGRSGHAGTAVPTSDSAHTVDPTPTVDPDARDERDLTVDASDPDPIEAGSADPALGTRRHQTSSPNPSFLALLRIDVEALVRGRVDGDELCEITGVGAVSVQRARELLGESILKIVITRGVDVLNVTHLGRGPTVAQRIALLWTSPWCTNARCANTLAIQHDHRTPWTEVHETKLENLDRLSPPCHRRKTHGGWVLVDGKGRRPLVPPDDRRHPSQRPRPSGGDHASRPGTDAA
jgi:Domain of unknown function (DUF222)